MPIDGLNESFTTSNSGHPLDNENLNHRGGSTPKCTCQGQRNELDALSADASALSVNSGSIPVPPSDNSPYDHESGLNFFLF